MSKISEEKIKKIKEEILALLFNKFPYSLFTAQIARELARDEEFIKKILFDLEKVGLVRRIKEKNGKILSRKILWQLTEKAYFAYKNLK
ncbi:MAG: hypothetical protein QXM27_02665 [Candidatus Pacearchaeota archaeon]